MVCTPRQDGALHEGLVTEQRFVARRIQESIDVLQPPDDRQRLIQRQLEVIAQDGDRPAGAGGIQGDGRGRGEHAVHPSDQGGGGMWLPGGIGRVDDHQVGPRLEPLGAAAQPAAGVVRLDEEQDVRPSQSRGRKVLEAALQVQLREAMPVQVLEHAYDGGPMPQTQGQGRGGRRRRLGASYRDDLGAGFARNPGRQDVRLAPGEHRL